MRTRKPQRKADHRPPFRIKDTDFATERFVQRNQEAKAAAAPVAQAAFAFRAVRPHAGRRGPKRRGHRVPRGAVPEFVGMLVEAAAEWSLDLKQSYMVGDRWRDVEAGKGAGCRTILIDGGYAERQAKDPDAVVHSLPEASALILSQQV